MKTKNNTKYAYTCMSAVLGKIREFWLLDRIYFAYERTDGAIDNRFSFQTIFFAVVPFAIYLHFSILLIYL